MTGFYSKRQMAADKLQEPVPFEKWWHYEGSEPPQQGEDHEEHTKRMCQIAWSNGAYVAAQSTQEPVAHVYLFDHDGRPLIAWDNAKGIKIGDKLYTTPPQRQWIWLSDADIAEVVDTTCQYSGGYEEYLIKKAERKIRSMNT